MAGLSYFSVIFAFCGLVTAEHLSFVKLPTYITVNKDVSTTDVNAVESTLSGLSGIAWQPSHDIQPFLTSSGGLKTPKLFLFLTIPETQQEILKENFGTITVEGAESAFFVSGFLHIVQSFFGAEALKEVQLPENQIKNGQLEDVLKQIGNIHHDRPQFIITPPLRDDVLQSKDFTAFLANLEKSFGEDIAVFGVEGDFSAIIQRKKRQAELRADPDDKDKYNLGEEYNKYYPVIFNIILWFGITMAVTTASIAYCIWFMDPGKDGIIYRRTASSRKKDL